MTMVKLNCPYISNNRILNIMGKVPLSRIKPTLSSEVKTVEEWREFESSGDVIQFSRSLIEEEAPE